MAAVGKGKIADQAKGHLDAFLGIVVIPIPALLVLGQAILTGGDQIEVFGLRLSVRAASLLVGVAVTVLLLAAARSLCFLTLLLMDKAAAAAAKEAIETHPSPLNPFLVASKGNAPVFLWLTNDLGAFFLGVLGSASFWVDAFAFAQRITWNPIQLFSSALNDPLGALVFFGKYGAFIVIYGALFDLASGLKRPRILTVMAVGFALSMGVNLLTKFVVHYDTDIPAFPVS
jgi:hypothetical protein